MASVAMASAATLLLLMLTIVYASIEYSRSSSEKLVQQKDKQTAQKKRPNRHIPVDFSDIEPIDILQDEQEERLLSILENMDMENQKEAVNKFSPAPTKKKKRKSKKSKKVKRNKIQRFEKVDDLDCKPYPRSTPSSLDKDLNKAAPVMGYIDPNRSIKENPAFMTPKRQGGQGISVSGSVERHPIEDPCFQDIQNVDKVLTSTANIDTTETQTAENGQRKRETLLTKPHFDSSHLPQIASSTPTLVTANPTTAPVISDSMDQQQSLPLNTRQPFHPSITMQRPSHIVQQQSRQPNMIRKMEQQAAMLSFTTPWVIDFLQSRPKDALLAVPYDFIGDGFNLVHLAPLVESLSGATSSSNNRESNDVSFPLYKAALRLILSTERHIEVPPAIQHAAERLYALVHGRYVTSPRGLDTLSRILMHDKEIFGKCPRPSCRGMPMLPCGESSPGRNAQRYCCSCGQVWESWESKVDGCAWGPSLCHLYLLVYGKTTLSGVGRILQQQPNPTATIPTIFGFQVHAAALKRLHQR